MKWQDLFTTYWSQVTLFLLMISYFVQRGLNLKSKKIEISHSLFQQNRLSAVNNFYANYAKVEFMWHQLAIWDVLDHKVKAAEMDEIIWNPLNDLKKTVLELKIYFSKDDHKKFEMLLNNFLLVNDNLGQSYSDYSQNKTLIQKTNEFNSFKDKILNENNLIIEEISEIIKKSFYNN